MAGHSQFKNIMHRKGAQDKKRAKVFTKLIRELTVAATGGEDPDANPRLRTAIIAAKAANMPKDTMERAIKRGSGGDEGANYQEVRYEGYGPQGVALIVEALTDNRNRTAAEVRSIFSKHGGNLGETGGVSFMFAHLGRLLYPLTLPEEAVLEQALEAGAEDFEKTETGFEILVAKESFAKVRDHLQKAYGDPIESGLVWVPETTTTPTGSGLETLEKLVEALEDNDDVQNVWGNFVFVGE